MPHLIIIQYEHSNTLHELSLLPVKEGCTLEFLVEICLPIFQIMTHFQSKTRYFSHPYRFWNTKSRQIIPYGYYFFWKPGDMSWILQFKCTSLRESSQHGEPFIYYGDHEINGTRSSVKRRHSAPLQKPIYLHWILMRRLQWVRNTKCKRLIRSWLRYSIVGEAKH